MPQFKLQKKIFFVYVIWWSAPVENLCSTVGLTLENFINAIYVNIFKKKNHNHLKRCRNGWWNSISIHNKMNNCQTRNRRKTSLIWWNVTIRNLHRTPYLIEKGRKAFTLDHRSQGWKMLLLFPLLFNNALEVLRSAAKQ